MHNDCERKQIEEDRLDSRYTHQNICILSFVIAVFNAQCVLYSAYSRFLNNPESVEKKKYCLRNCVS